MTDQFVGEGSKIPQLPYTQVTDPQLRPVVEGIRTIFNVRAFNKDPLERWVTWRDLIANNVVVYRDGNTNLVGGASNFFSFGQDPEDFTPPPAPVNVTATSAALTIILEWDDPQYSNLGYAEIWRATTNNLAEAVRIGTTGSFLYADSVGRGSLTYYYWVRFVSKKDVVGPYNSLIGTMSATGLVGGVDLTDLIITAEKLAADAVESGKIKDAAVTTTKIANLAVGNAAIQNAAITNAKIADLAVDSAKIVNASIVTAKIADGNITTAKIGDAQITTAKIANLAVGTANIINGAITNAKIGDAEINNAKISSLDAGKINTGFLSADRIQAGSIVADKIDSRNLTIKDAAGNIIFGAGTNLDWGRISGQPGNIFNGNISIGANGVLYGAGGGQVSLGGLGAGNFAFINYLDAGNITSYIAGAAIGTALIQNAAITNALIANGAISQAKIGDAEISTAKIGVAQIDTLRIAGNAVTTMGILNATAGQTIYVNAPYGGALALILWVGDFQGENLFGVPDSTVRVYVDGGLQVAATGAFVDDGGNGVRTAETKVVSVSLGAGNHSITVTTPYYNYYYYGPQVGYRAYTCIALLTQR